MRMTVETWEPIPDDSVAGDDLNTLLAGVTNENRHDPVRSRPGRRQGSLVDGEAAR